MRRLTILLLVALVAVRSASACSCTQTTICQRLDQQPVIFLGEVVSGGVDPGTDPWQSRASSARLKVIEAFRGIPTGAEEVEVELTFMPGWCSPSPYLRGERILVMARRRNGKITDGGCTQSYPERNPSMSEALAITRKFSRGNAKPEIRGTIAPNVSADSVEYVIATHEAGPVAGVTVILEDRDKTYQAVSGPDGTYSISGMPPGSYRIRTEAPGFDQPDGPRTVTVKQGGCVVQDLGLRTRNSVEGYVFDHNNKPVGGLTVFLNRKDSKRMYGKKGKTDAAGAFRFTEVNPGEHTLVVSPEGETARSPYPRTAIPAFIQVDAASSISHLVLTLPPPIPTRSLRIHVSGPDGKEVTKGFISCYQAGKEKDLDATESASPQPGGAICRVLADRPYRIRVWPARSDSDFSKLPQPVEVVVAPGLNDAEVHLKIP